jgi:hypothetical protein
VSPSRLLAAALALAAPAAASSSGDAIGVAAPGGLGSNFVFGGGYAFFSQQTERGRVDQGGVALTARFETEVAARTDFGLTLTWGLTDWDRAGEYIDAGNRSGRWTTDSLARIEAWVANAPKDEKGARFLGAIFADIFLVFTYAAVPVCYVSSAGGATSFLELDATATYRLGEGRSFAFLEGGVGAPALPYRIADWRGAFGPVAGVGMQLAGLVRIGARALWSPPALNHAPFGGTTTMGSITLSSPR